jgi:hypothetical protein
MKEYGAPGFAWPPTAEDVDRNICVFKPGAGLAAIG